MQIRVIDDQQPSEAWVVGVVDPTNALPEGWPNHGARHYGVTEGWSKSAGSQKAVPKIMLGV